MRIMTGTLSALPFLLWMMQQPQTVPPPQGVVGRPELAGVLDFEADHVDGVPKNWSGGPRGYVCSGRADRARRPVGVADRADGRESEHVDRRLEDDPDRFRGEQLELRGFLRTADISNFAGLWMRQDDDAGLVAFENMQARQLKGTTEWTEYAIVLPLNRAAKRLVFGVLAAGIRTGMGGRPSPARRRETHRGRAARGTAQDGRGSRQGIRRRLGNRAERVDEDPDRQPRACSERSGGSLKSHHPLVTAGNGTGTTSCSAFFRACWPRPMRPPHAPPSINGLPVLGPRRRAARCATLVETETAPAAAGNLVDGRSAWSRARVQLSAESTAIGSAEKQQFYVSLAPNIGNPSFEHEPAYPTLRLPDAGYQLLALYRFWNIVEYWFPYRDVIGLGLG